jgi:hypothetical protein
MRLLKLTLSLCAWIVLALEPTDAAAESLSTPEIAVEAYIVAVAARDFDAVLATTAAENMAKDFDFVSFVDRLGVLTSKMPAPSTDPLFTAINNAQMTGQVSAQLQFLVYGLMTTSDVVDGVTVTMDATAAQDLVDVLRADRLSGLKLEEIAIPMASIQNGERYQVNATRLAKSYGAGSMTERVALVSFEGLNFAVGFTLLEYDGQWRIMSQNSALLGFPASGAPKRIQAGEFVELIK